MGGLSDFLWKERSWLGGDPNREGPNPGLGFLFGEKAGYKTPQSQQLYNTAVNQSDITKNPLYGQGESYLQSLLSGTDQDFENYYKPLTDRFTNQVAPKIAGQFAGAGNMRANSGLNSALTEGLRELGNDLGMRYSDLRQSAMDRILPYIQAPGQQSMKAVKSLGNQFFQGETQGALPAILSILGQLGGSAAGGPVGGAAGSALGGMIGQGIGNSFKVG